MDKFFFEIMLNEILESCENDICWYKNWCKTRNKKTGSYILQLFTELPSQNVMAFHATWYCPLRMGRIGGVVGFLLKDQNMLSMTKVICQGSLSWMTASTWIQNLSSKVHPLSRDVKISCNTKLSVSVHRPTRLRE